MTASLSRADLEARHDFAASRSSVEAALARAVQSPEGLLRFLGQYVAWNSWFGISVSGLAAKIGRLRHSFHDDTEAIRACSDRAMHVASFFFDAARDEFDDRDTTHRDTHRTLAQAVLKAAAFHLGFSAQAANELLAEDEWLLGLHARTREGYGIGTPDDAAHAFAGMGFHLGSEVLADQEFVTIDRTLRRAQPSLVEKLLNTRVSLAGQDHAAYSWIAVHTHVEADHFEWAVQGVREAMRYAPAADGPAMRGEVLRGFDRFAACHADFFARCG